MKSDEPIGLSHPCKNVCSGWQQGYDEGYTAIKTELELAKAEVERLEITLALAKSAKNADELHKILERHTHEQKQPITLR